MNKDHFVGGIVGAYAVVLIGFGIYYARAALDRRFQQLGWRLRDIQTRNDYQPASPVAPQVGGEA